MDRAVLTAPRPSLAASRGLWVAVAAGAVVAASIAGFVWLDHNGEPEGSGLIVVQAPSSSSTATEPAPAEPPAAPLSAAQPVEPIALDERVEPRSKKGTAAKGRKPAPTDPMQLMAARVAESFSKQKASVIQCLNEHSADLEGAPQLQVRLQVDRTGTATASELLPLEISSKPVARCIKAAVTNMSFPRPEQPMTFRVPLLWRRK
jgi:hypothetical protein